MDIKAYIESGVLEEYCLGLLNAEEQAYLIQITMLYPEVKAELTAVELVMENIAIATATEPAPANRQRILSSLGFEDASAMLDINNLPAVDETADHQTWLNTLAHLIPEAEPTEDFLVHVIRNDSRYQQMLVITKNDVPEEEHGDLLESFFILEGHCECTVGNELYQLNPGDFLEIPLNVKHDIKIVSPYVVGILQYQFV
ncbi:cupin domain-containing protein [Mucilaginibacter sp.]|uniref:cupin domain-containing protein n=1 Tax=Mucilaginibacter sp. TaxID=1882438 RepID=UPI003D0A2428